MKPVLPLTLLALLLTAAAWAVTKPNATRVYVNGLPLHESAIVKDGVTYVPLRAVAESLGCQVTWDPRLGVLLWSNTPQLPTAPEAPVPGIIPYPRAPAFQAPTPGVPSVPVPRL